jgi:hypothetical protein
MSRNLRDYGLAESTPTGRPRLVRTHTEPVDGLQPECPNCHCQALCEIEVAVDQPLLRGGKGIGIYLSCPACAWAAPMLVRSTATVGEGG